MSWVAENTDVETLEALERMYERGTERRQRFCNDCQVLTYASSVAPQVCGLCGSDDLEVKS